jgi:hypothetical protein
MADSFITMDNFCEAAKFLSTVDRYAIKPQILEDSEDFILELKITMDRFFNAPLTDAKQSAHFNAMIFDKRISELLNATKNLYDILTDDGKDTVKKYLENKKGERFA